MIQTDLRSSDIVFDYVTVYIAEHSYPPSLRNIARGCQLSLGAVAYNLTLLKLEDAPFDNAPRQVFPFIHRLVSRVHDVFTSTGLSTFQFIVPTSAYPLAFPTAFAF